MVAAAVLLQTMPFPVPQLQLATARRRLELESAIDMLVNMSEALGPRERAQLRRVYRVGGPDAPPMATIASHVRKLLDLYIKARGLSTAG